MNSSVISHFVWRNTRCLKTRSAFGIINHHITAQNLIARFSTSSGPIQVEPAKGPMRPPRQAIDDKCGPMGLEEEDAESDVVPMIDPKTGEWGGPTKGGSAPEPTRFGDWERKGRCTDF